MQDATIAAIATAPGEGGIAIVRVSGPLAGELFQRVFRRKGGKAPRPRMLHYGQIYLEDEVLDEAMGVFLPGPHTYTREDMCEVHCHGGNTAAKRALNAFLVCGAQLAAPGEFTRRAFENGRITLSQAEGVMEMIRAQSDAAAKYAARQMEGRLPGLILKVQDLVTALQAQIAAATDFPDEIDEVETSQAVAGKIEKLIFQISAAMNPHAGELIKDGVQVALVGRPNVGKSSLLNRLLGAERAIVDARAGTTRDIVSGQLMVSGLPVTILDTAGQRSTRGEIERRGVEMARRAQREADIVFLVLDGAKPLLEGDLRLLRDMDERCTVVVNKGDKPLQISACEISEKYGKPVVETSAVEGHGVEKLIEIVARHIEGAHLGEGLIVGQRHVACAREALLSLQSAKDTLTGGMPLDMAAIDLENARQSLGEITGQTAAEDVISAVFANFCVGK